MHSLGGSSKARDFSVTCGDCIGKDLVDLLFIALIEALWHAENDPGAAVIADQHLAVRESDALDFTLEGDIVQRPLQEYRPGGF